MKRIIALVLSLILSLSLCACNGKLQNEPSDQNSAAALTLDNYGRQITLSGVPQKVLTLGPNCSELFVALGLADRVIGNSLDNHSRGPLPEYAEEYAKIPELNYSSATREAVITSGADFIYGIDWEFGDSALDIDELTGYGITVYQNAASTLEEIYREIEDLGKIFHVEDKAAAFIQSQKDRIEAVRKARDGLDPVKVLVYDSGNDGVFTCGGTNFESLLIQQAGGKNIFDDLTEKQWVTVSYEEVLSRNPDVIVIHDYDSPSVEEKIAEIKANPALSQLDCVKNERFVTIELESVLPGSRMAYAVERLSQGFVR